MGRRCFLEEPSDGPLVLLILLSGCHYCNSLYNRTPWDFLAEALFQAGWLRDRVSDLFDEELYLGAPELLGGRIEYQTRRSLRKRFALDFIEGRFSNTLSRHGPTLSYDVEELSFHIGTFVYDLKRLIWDANLALKQRLTPGSCYGDPQSRPVSGVDFDSSLFGYYLHQRLDIRDWSAYEDD